MTLHKNRLSDRASQCKNKLGKQLFKIIDDKQSNLCFSADVTRCNELLTLADRLGPEICVLKTHVDILEDFTPKFSQELITLAKKHQFLIFEDRKFADIGNTVKSQYSGGIYRIADWADITNAHSLPGPGIVKGLMEVGAPKGRGLLLLAEMSSENNLADAIYAQKTLEIAEQFPDYVLGFISQRKITDDPQWVYFTPGVRLTEGVDKLGQQYITPEIAAAHGSDVIIVGRGILAAKDPVTEAKKYREAAWSYL